MVSYVSMIKIGQTMYLMWCWVIFMYYSRGIADTERPVDVKCIIDDVFNTKMARNGLSLSPFPSGKLYLL